MTLDAEESLKLWIALAGVGGSVLTGIVVSLLTARLHKEGKLHERRIAVAAEFCKRLYAIQRQLMMSAGRDEDLPDRTIGSSDGLTKALDCLEEFNAENSIYLKEATGYRIETFIYRIHNAVYPIDRYDDDPKTDSPEVQAILDEAPKLRRAIEAEMRALVGTSSAR